MTARLIVCGDCGEQRQPHAQGTCKPCYSRNLNRRQREEHDAAMAALVTVRADGLLTSDYYRRWQASRRPELPSRVYRVQTDDAGLVRVARRVL